MFIPNIYRQLLAAIAVLACTSVLATPPPPPAPELQDLANASYKGLIDIEGVITLSDGHWQGEPWVEGGDHDIVIAEAVVAESFREGDLLNIHDTPWTYS